MNRRLLSALLCLFLLNGCAKSGSVRPNAETPEPGAAPAEIPSPAPTPELTEEPDAKPDGYSDEELCVLARSYYEKHHNFTPPVVVVDSRDGDLVTIHLYEDLSDHTATLDWYTIDCRTGKGSGMLEGEIDLTE